MARWLPAAGVLLALQSSTQVLAADMDVRPYLSHPYRDDRRPRPAFNNRSWSVPPPLPGYETPSKPAQRSPEPQDIKPTPPQRPDAVQRPDVVTPAPTPKGPPSDAERNSLILALLGFTLFGLVLKALDYLVDVWEGIRTRSRSRSKRNGAAVSSAAEPAMTGRRTAQPQDNREDFLPTQDGWARRASAVRNPVSGFVFSFQARANARAMAEEQKRAKAARDTAKEYSGMLKDLVEGQDAATAYSVRRDLMDELYEHERAKQQDAFDEGHHHRWLAAKRREIETIESDTRRIEAAHEQEALERFKEPKFAAGLARFAEKEKGYQVGAASADAAIAETKVPPKPEASGNENADVLQLHGLLQSAMQAVEQGEQRGEDTQVLRKRVELLKQLLNLA